MSKPGGKKGAPKVAAKTQPKTDDESSERATPAAIKSEMDNKDEVSSNGDKKDASKSIDEITPPKPQSAGASTRDAAQKLLGLTMRQEWTPIEQVMKSLEKAVAGASSDDINTTPLAGVMDPVSKMFVFRSFCDTHMCFHINSIP